MVQVILKGIQVSKKEKEQELKDKQNGVVRKSARELCNIKELAKEYFAGKKVVNKVEPANVDKQEHTRSISTTSTQELMTESEIKVTHTNGDESGK